MRKLLYFISENSIKLLIVFKIIVVVGIILHTKGGLYIGEKPLSAAEEKAQKEEGKGKELAQNTPQSKNTINVDEEEDEEPRRKSFLHDLLNLPAIETDELKKEEVARYLSLIERKRSQVEDRLSLLEKRELQLKNLEKTLENKIKKLEEEMRFFEQTLQKEKKVNDERLDSLAEFYKKMPPKKAAPVFEKMDKDLIVALFNKFPKKQTTEILGLMNPERSVEITEYFGRIRSGNEYNMLKEINNELTKEFQECKGMPAH